MPVLNVKLIATLGALSLLIATICSEIIIFIAYLGFPEWAAAALFHTFLGIGVLFAFYFWPNLRAPMVYRHALLKRHPHLIYMPAAFVFLVSILLALWKAAPPYHEPYLSIRSVLSISLVPISEEVCYRLGLSRLLSCIGGRFWGGYFSILIFTMMHGLPSFERIYNLDVGFFLGPFLLAISCELLFAWSNRLFPAILLHMACNSTGVIFALTGGYWLDVFKIFYH